MQLQTYTRTPIDVEALQWTGHNTKEIFELITGFGGCHAMYIDEFKIILMAPVVRYLRAADMSVINYGDFIQKCTDGKLRVFSARKFKEDYITREEFSKTSGQFDYSSNDPRVLALYNHVNTEVFDEPALEEVSHFSTPVLKIIENEENP